MSIYIDINNRDQEPNPNTDKGMVFDVGRMRSHIVLNAESIAVKIVNVTVEESKARLGKYGIMFDKPKNTWAQPVQPAPEAASVKNNVALIEQVIVPLSTNPLDAQRQIYDQTVVRTLAPKEGVPATKSIDVNDARSAVNQAHQTLSLPSDKEVNGGINKLQEYANESNLSGGNS